MSYLFTVFEVELATVNCNASSRYADYNDCVYTTDGYFTTPWFSEQYDTDLWIEFYMVPSRVVNKVEFWDAARDDTLCLDLEITLDQVIHPVRY